MPVQPQRVSATADVVEYLRRAPIATWTLDASAGFTYANPAALVLLQREAGALGAMTLWDVVAPADIEPLKREFSAVLRTGRYEREHRLVRGDGKVILVELRLTVPEPGVVLCFATDMNTAGVEETRSSQSERRFRLFMDHSPTIAWIKDDAGRYVYMNATVEREFNTTRDRLIGRTDEDILPPELATRYRREDLETQAAGVPLKFEEPHTDKTGAVRWWSTLKFVYEPSPGRRFVAGLGLDVTERKQLEDALGRAADELRGLVAERTVLLASREHDLQMLLNSVPVIVSAWDTRLHNRYINKFYAEWRHHAPEKLHGAHVREFVGERVFSTYSSVYEAAARGEPQQFVREFFDPQRPDGVGYLQVECVPDVYEGQVRGFISLATDVTDLKRAQIAAETANKLKDQFLANMSHEMRTPLNVILGFAEVGLGHSATDPLIRDFLGRILHSGRSLLGLVNELLDFSAIEADQLRIERRSMRPSDVAERAVMAFEDVARRKNVELRHEAGPGATEDCRGDPARIEQVLVNLIGNALKFTESGSVIVSSGVEQGLLVFRVRDTGIGIAADLLERIFLPFEQADASVTRKLRIPADRDRAFRRSVTDDSGRS